MVIAILLPGVAVGDNLKVFLLALTQPLLVISNPNGAFLPQLICGTTVYLTFLAWAKAQKTAIDGGNFAAYLDTLPMNPKMLFRTHILMVLLANHFLWIFICFGILHLIFADAAQPVYLFRYSFLIVLLISAQYISVFSIKSKPLIKLGLLYFLMLLLILPVPVNFEWFRVISLTLLSIYLCHLITSKNTQALHKTNQETPYKKGLKQHFYLQMLFKSSLSSTCFRLLWIAAIIIGFILAADHFKSNNEGSLYPYAIATTGLLAFFLSGFYLLFRDQRLTIKSFLVTLPIPQLYWIKRDLAAIFLISVCFHIPFYFWQLNHFNHLLIIKTWLFHILLLLISYPIRIKAKEPTFSTFITLLITTVIYIYNFT